MPLRPANLVHTDEAALVESIASGEENRSVERRENSSAVERLVHIEDVGGSIPSSPTIPDRLTYAIGDIHGRLDLLERAADAIEAHLAGRAGHVICLGDYVDRGPQSRGVVEFLMRAQAAGACTCLKGNHEDLMLKALAGGDVDLWIVNGGWATLESYGGKLADVPAEHIAWMQGLPLVVHDDLRAYVHAGFMPGFPISEQDAEACMWIRERFLRDTEGFEKHVVHGHTHTWAAKRTAEPELLKHRTNLDTGAFHTGVLAVAVFDDTQDQPLEVLMVR